jgi:hypothetical protein
MLQKTEACADTSSRDWQKQGQRGFFLFGVA